MLALLPAILFATVILATLLRGRAVAATSGASAWAFRHARGAQRTTGLAFALSIAALAFGTALLALGRIDPAPAALFPGSTIIAAGSLVVIAAQRQMGAAWRIGVRQGDAPLFFTAGLFRFSRNPVFVGMIAMAFGAALALSALWAWLAAAVFAIACALQVRIEEAHLAREFGARYDDFRRATPRWLVF